MTSQGADGRTPVVSFSKATETLQNSSTLTGPYQKKAGLRGGRECKSSDLLARFVNARISSQRLELSSMSRRKHHPLLHHATTAIFLNHAPNF